MMYADGMRYCRQYLFISLILFGFFLFIPSGVKAATFQMQTGYYVGDGADNRAITGVGFQPQLIIIKDDTGNGSLGALWKSSSMSGETTAHTADANADIASDAIQSLDSDGFTLGTNADVNAANVRFTWIAFRGSDCTSSGTFCVGSYSGDGASTHALTSVGFSPNLVVVKGSGATSGAYMTSSMPSNDAQSFSSANEVTDGSVFKTLDSTGFTVGNATRVNTSATNYWFFAFKTASNAFSVGTFTGDGTDNRTITAPGYRPNYVWLKNANATTPIRTEFNVTESYGDYSGAFTDTNNTIGEIKSLDATGFTVGTAASANESGKTLYWVAFGGASNPSGSGTYAMKVGSYTGNGTAQSFTSFGFTPDLVIVKDAAGATHPVFRTSLMKGDSTAYLGNTVANFTGGITSLDSGGFTVAADATVNTNGTVYHYQAFGGAFNPEKNTGAADFMIGAYTGAAIDNRNITRMPFQPDLVGIKANSAASGIWRTSDETGDASIGFSGIAETTDNIQGFNSDGFQVGTTTRANGGTTTVFNFFSFKASNTMVVNHYSGTGSAQNITSLSFSPNLLWVKSTGATVGVFRPSTLLGNSTLYFTATAAASDRITGFLSNGFSIGGNQTETNTSATTYRYAAWKINGAPGTPTLDSPADGATGVSATPALLTTASDTESDYLRYKIELCTDVSMTTACQTFNQVSSQTGWSNQNSQTSTAYTSGSQATYTIQSALSYGTTYYWRSYAIDPGGANTFSSTQTPHSFTTLAVPTAPSSLSGSAASTTSITWSFTDNASNEDGFIVQTTGGATMCTVASASSGTGSTVTCTESGLTANTSYTRKVVAYNAAGNSTASSNASAVTLSTAPTSGNITGSTTTSTWTNNSAFTFTNTLGFGAGSVQYFRYVWDTTSSHTFNDTETQWTSSTLSKTATSDSNSWYLHLKGYNSADVANGTVNLGAYYFDGTGPTTPGTPTTASSSSNTTPTWTWTASTDVSSGLASTPYTVQWSQDASFLSGVSSSTSTTNSFTHSIALTGGTWYFRVQATDLAGNTSSLSSNGTFVLSTTTPAPSLPDEFNLDSPANDSYTNSERPSFRWNVPTSALSGVSSYSVTIDNGDTGDFSLVNIPVSRTSDYETSKYIAHYDGFSDSDAGNNYISVYSKSSTDWSTDSNSGNNDGKLKEGKRSWKVTAHDNSGNIREEGRSVFVDLTRPNLFVTKTNNTPSFTGKITDPLAGDKTDTMVASGPKSIEVKIEKKDFFGIYDLYSVTTVTINDIFWDGTTDKITDNSVNTADKYSNFDYTPINKLPAGTYKITLTAYDNTDNTSIPALFNISIYTPTGRETITSSPTPVPEETISITPNVTIEVTPSPIPTVTPNPQTSHLLSDLGHIISSTFANFIHFFGNVATYIANIFQQGREDLAQILNAPREFGARVCEWIAYSTTSFREIVLDSTPTQISEVKVEESSPTTMTITWKTNHLSTSKVNYGPTKDYGQDVQSNVKVHDHRVEITDLSPSTTYNYEVMSQGKNYVYDANHEFTTPEE